MVSRALWVLSVWVAVAGPSLAGQATVYTWDDGETHGWSADNDKYKFEVTGEKTYDGRGKSLKISGQVSDYIGVSIYKPVKDENTKVLIVYYAEGLAGDLVVQARSNEEKKNLHVMVNPTVQGRWATAEIKLEQMTDWGGKVKAKGHTFGFLQVYAGPKKGAQNTAIYLARVAVYSGEDREPPKAPEGAAGAVQDLGVDVAWDRAADNVCTAGYEVHRGMKPDFEPSGDNRIGQTAQTRFRDDSLANFGTYYYRVRAVDSAGNRGPASAAAKVTVSE